MGDTYTWLPTVIQILKNIKKSTLYSENLVLQGSKEGRKLEVRRLNIKIKKIKYNKNRCTY